MNEEDDDLSDLIVTAPRMPAKDSIIDGTIWQDQVMNQLRVNSPTASFMQQVSNTTASSSMNTDTFSAADVATGSQIGWGLRFGTIEPRPALQARPA